MASKKGARGASANTEEKTWTRKLETDRRWTETLRDLARSRGLGASDLAIVIARASEYPRASRSRVLVDEWLVAAGSVDELNNTALPLTHYETLSAHARQTHPEHSHAVLCFGAPPFAIVRFRLPR